MKKEVKLLFSDAGIIYTKIIENSLKICQSIETNEYSEVTGHKINIQKLSCKNYEYE